MRSIKTLVFLMVFTALLGGVVTMIAISAAGG
jgi:hypothetical protein